MKKTLLILLCFPLLTLAQQTYVPDDNFEAYLEANGMGNGTANDDSVTTSNINTVTYLDVSIQTISDLTGIEDFTSLTDLNCFSNQLTNLDVSNNTALTFLECADNQLTSLDVNQNTALNYLDIEANALTSLDVRNGNNQNISIFYVNNNPNLTCINVDDIAYSTANWTDIDAQHYFSTNCAQPLPQTYVPDDNFEQALINLGYDAVLDDSVTTALINTVTSLELISLNISDLTGIEAFTALSELSCLDNQLTVLDVSNNTALNVLSCYSNQLTSLDVSNNTALTYLNCHTNQLTNLDVSNNTALTILSCQSNQLTSLDVNQNTALNYLECADNQLTTLDLSLNVALSIFYCENNQLTSLDVSSNTALTFLACADNQLTVLDVSQNTALTLLYCYSNQLTSLDFRNGQNTLVVDFSTTGNPDLTCINVDDAAYSTANWKDVDAQTSFNEDCSSVVGIKQYSSSKTLIKTINIMGRETTFRPNTLLIYLYDDGSAEKAFTQGVLNN